MRSCIAFSVLFAVLFAVGDVSLAQPDLEAGRNSYAVCAGCHGFLAEGNATVHAPKLAGLEPWYLARQMRSFITGLRGVALEDTHGKRMAAMALAASSERTLENILAYVDTLPVLASPATVDGDLKEGQRLYAVCAACHGADGSGNEATSSPGLAGLDDWYIVDQLVLYVKGLRGAEPGDTYGRQMQPFVTMFATDDSQRNLAAYITSMNR